MNSLQKAILYTRVSSKEQAEEGYSLDAQERLLQDYAIRNSLEVVRVFKISESASGKHLRKLFYEVFNFATKDKVDIILCEKIDRLTRNLKDAVMVDDWVKESSNRAVHFVKENFILNQNTKAHDNFMWDVKVATARLLSNNLSEEVKKGQKEKLEQGGMPYRPPLGYMSLGDKGHKSHVVNPETSVYIKKAFELYSTGLYSLASLATKMFEFGLRSASGRKLYKNNLYLILNNKYYYGEIVWNGKVYQGKHEPLISRDLFDSVQRVMKTGRPSKYQKHNPLFRGMAECGECNHKISWYMKKGHWYGRCANYKVCNQNKLPIREDRMADQLFTYFEDLSLSEADIGKIKNELQKDHVSEIGNRKMIEGDLKRKIGIEKSKLDVLYEDRLARRITVEKYDQKRNDIEQQLNRLTATWDNFNKNEIDYFDFGVNLLELATKAKDLVSYATKEEKQEIFTLAFEALKIKNKTLETKYTPWFAKLQKHLPQLRQICEPKKSIVSTKQNDQIESDRLIWLLQ
ncbi:MAG TPA: recombinase family protein [Candidatus Binatia bacterium]|nr:recombinase family protein [Candidatus Binatia bacterium]